MEFEPGKVYRRQEIHDEMGGQRYGGISTPVGSPTVLLFTGEAGEQHGYHDGFQDSGTFLHTGEGQVGDMEMKGGNLAIRDHQQSGKDLHLFEIARKGYVRYLGRASCLGYEEVQAPDKNGNCRRAYVFELGLEDGGSSGSPVEIEDVTKVSNRLWKLSLTALRVRALREPPKTDSNATRKTGVQERSEAVRVYVLRRADGKCEGCNSPAPFDFTDGQPYLEAHHIRRVADRGPDHPAWVIALCPNCHRRVHYGKDGNLFNQELTLRAARIEESLKFLSDEEPSSPG